MTIKKRPPEGPELLFHRLRITQGDGISQSDHGANLPVNDIQIVNPGYPDLVVFGIPFRTLVKLNLIFNKTQKQSKLRALEHDSLLHIVSFQKSSEITRWKEKSREVKNVIGIAGLTPVVKSKNQRNEHETA